MRSTLVLGLLAPLLVAGCSSLPTCGTAEAQGAPSCTYGFAGTLAASGISPAPPRDYTTNPVTLPAPTQTVQPTFGTTGEEYQTIAVNTPQGLVYKRCKVLNGKVVACF
jgi:hypothetical protein